MKRVQLFEFEDFNWFPDVIRKNLTKLLIVFNKMMKVDEAVANELKPLLNDNSQIVDLGTGAGGIMPDVIEKLSPNLKLVLTDLYPNPDSINQFKNHPNISYSSDSTNAEHLSNAPEGIKTMVNCFHHMPIPVAKNILASAQKNKQTLLIYELSNKPIPVLVWWLFLPIGFSMVFIMSLILTLFSKPSLKQLFFTYIIPVIPFVFAWDGQASMPRTYCESDLNELTASFPQSDDYQWKYQIAKNDKGKPQGYCFIGQPKIIV